MIKATNLLLASAGLAAACSPAPGYPDGVLFSTATYGEGNNLYTSTKDPNVLGARLGVYSAQDKSYGALRYVDASIDLATGAISPALQSPTHVTPQATTDVHKGWSLFIDDGNVATITSSRYGVPVSDEKVDNLEFSFPLEFSPDFSLGSHDFFVSKDVVYVLYETNIDCKLNRQHERCSSCYGCLRQFERRVFIFNLPLQTGFSVVADGIDVEVRSLYESIGLAEVGRMDSCGGRRFISYSPESAVPVRSGLQVEHLTALVSRGETKLFYDIVQSTDVAQDGELLRRTMTGAKLLLKELETGAIVKELELDVDALQRLAALPVQPLRASTMTTSESLESLSTSGAATGFGLALVFGLITLVL